MDLSQINPGLDIPNEINVVIEIPVRGEPVKYEIEKVLVLFSLTAFWKRRCSIR